MIDLRLLGLLERGNAIERCERGLPARIRVEGRDPDQPVHTALAFEHAVCISALHDERRRGDAGLLTFLHLVELDVEALALRPTRVHTKEHLRPVLRVRSSGTRVDLADRVTHVVLAAEQRA